MSVRRLADESVQPAEFAFSNDNAKWAEWKIGQYPAGRQQSAIIPLLMRVQDQDGWISRAAIEAVADMLDMPYIRALEVATFYTQFQLHPVGTRAHILVCGTTPCMLRGAEDLRAVCERKIHPKPNQLNADGTMSWEEVECIGACVNGPMVAIYHDTYEDLTPERFEEIVDAFAAGKGDTIPAGPQNGRHFSAPVTGRTTLLETPSATRETFVPPIPPEEPAAQTAVAPVSQEPTTKGRQKDVSAEAAPAIAGPHPDAKVSQGKAETERKDFNKAADADGTPSRAMRPDTTGAESAGGKLDGGAAVGKKADTREDPALNPTQAQPAPLFEAPSGEADDLKMISGIGVVLERSLKEQGITTFAQIAALEQADIERIEERLRFKGRVGRDDWIKQAQALATGGEAEYIRVFGKKPK